MTKRCPKCGTEKPLDQFPTRGRLRSGNERYGYCKPCHVVYQRRYKLQQFGMTEAEYDLLLDRQDGCCAICDRPPRNNRLAVDHDHETGDVRGLLCASCNGVLGRWKDDVERFRAAAKYLEVTLERM